jgi:hypothetical protein
MHTAKQFCEALGIDAHTQSEALRDGPSDHGLETAIPADDLRILGGAGRGQLSEWFDIFLLVFCRASREVL